MPPPCRTTTRGIIKFDPGISGGVSLSVQANPAAAVSLGAPWIRLQADISTSTASFDRSFNNFANAGIKVLPVATFNGRTPTVQEAQNLGNWAARYGPGGTFWAS